ncbi:MAG: hypothetical protein R2856_00425 [Caldilineaceae bacterium]
MQGVAPANVAELEAGTRAHNVHGRNVQRAHRLQRVGVFLLAVGLILIGLTLLVSVLGRLLIG